MYCTQVFGISLLWLMVGVAVCKQLTSPDLGCSAYMNEADCMVMMQPFDGSAHACAWDPMIDPPCDTAPPDTSSNFTPLSIAMLVIVMLCIDPFILVIEVGAATGGEKAARTRLLLNATSGGRRAAWDYCALTAVAIVEQRGCRDAATGWDWGRLLVGDARHSLATCETPPETHRTTERQTLPPPPSAAIPPQSLREDRSPRRLTRPLCDPRAPPPPHHLDPRGTHGPVSV